jgi:hypothetical protein
MKAILLLKDDDRRERTHFPRNIFLSNVRAKVSSLNVKEGGEGAFLASTTPWSVRQLLRQRDG